LQKYEKKLAKAQKDLARKKGSKKCEEKSNSYIRQKQKVAKLHEKVANSRKNLLHEISREVVDNYDTIALEDLNVQGMKQNRKLAKNISDVSWGMFKEMLKYKAERDNKQVVAINRYYPSSKTCHICGDEKENLSLSEREWTCSNGHVLDRDLNAAINILNQGLLKLESAADVDNTGGVEVNPVSTGV
jgi:putative transposase